jgi:hypothetical protein
MKAFLAGLFAAFSLLGAAPVSAHSTSTSFLVVEAATAGDPVALRWDLSLHDLVWTVFIDRDFDGVVTWREVQDSRSSIQHAVLSQIDVARGGAPCALRMSELALAERLEQNHLSVLLVATCPQPGRLSIGGALFMSADASQRMLVSALGGAETSAGVVGPGARWEEPERVSAWRGFVRFVGEGIWHVLIGYDHIAFVLLLLLPSVLRSVDGRWRGDTRLGQVARDILFVVTAFTVAHSTTLALSATGTVSLPAQPIEIAIAASIAVAGAINLLPRLSHARLWLAFGFGLVHGFGFANVLSEVDTQGTSLLPLLGGFNIGVEIAQLAIVSVVLPVIYAVRASRWYSTGVMPLGSCALGAAGLVWMIQRI